MRIIDQNGKRSFNLDDLIVEVEHGRIIAYTTAENEAASSPMSFWNPNGFCIGKYHTEEEAMEEFDNMNCAYESGKRMYRIR